MLGDHLACGDGARTAANVSPGIRNEVKTERRNLGVYIRRLTGNGASVLRRKVAKIRLLMQEGDERGLSVGYADEEGELAHPLHPAPLKPSSPLKNEGTMPANPCGTSGEEGSCRSDFGTPPRMPQSMSLELANSTQLKSRLMEINDGGVGFQWFVSFSVM